MRLAKIDLLRGLNLISMIFYHAIWDIVFIFGKDVPWYRGIPGYRWQQSICCTFILLSGFSWPLGHRHFKRGMTVFLCGALITLVTLFFMPADVVWFGILTFMGSAMLLMIPLDKSIRPLSKKYAGLLFIIGMFLFIITRDINYGDMITIKVPAEIYANYVTAFFGFPPVSFFSTDYFSLIPWFFLYLCGYALYYILPVEEKENPLTRFLSESICPPLEFTGRHTLIIYMLHQPVIFGFMWLVFSFSKVA